MTRPSNMSALTPPSVVHPSVIDDIEFATSADGFPVARIGDVVLGLVSNGNDDLFIVSAWRFSGPLMEVRRKHLYGHDGRVKDEAAFRRRAMETAEHARELAALARVQTRMSASTPWGSSQLATIHAAGIISHSTSGHGGFHLSADRNIAVDAAVRNAGGWYEEDVEWAVVALTFPAFFTGYERRCADKTARNAFPRYWEKLHGRMLAPGESSSRDRAEFDREHAEDWVVISAIQSGHHTGMTEVIATIGGKRGGGKSGGCEERRFLVSQAEYAKRGPFGFVVDAKQHAPYDGPSGFAIRMTRAAS